VLTGREQADWSRTRRRPEFGPVDAIARPLVTALLQCHGFSCLAAAGGRLLRPGDAQARVGGPGGTRRATASLRHRPVPRSPERSSGLDRPGDRNARRAIAGVMEPLVTPLPRREQQGRTPAFAEWSSRVPARRLWVCSATFRSAAPSRTTGSRRSGQRPRCSRRGEPGARCTTKAAMPHPRSASRLQLSRHLGCEPSAAARPPSSRCCSRRKRHRSRAPASSAVLPGLAAADCLRRAITRRDHGAGDPRWRSRGAGSGSRRLSTRP
jgi:hypothetical protein